MQKIEMFFRLDDFPKQLHPYLQNSRCYDYSSHSSARVMYSDKGYFLKIDRIGQLAEEYKTAKSFDKLGLGVPVLDYVTHKGADYLVTKKADGQTALDFLSSPEKVVKTLALALKQLHQSNYQQASLTNRLDTYRQTATENAAKGAFYAKSLLPRFNISGKEEAYQLITEKGHLLQADSFIHGDSCLPNIILKDAETFSCFIDLGLAGWSDKHIDLFWVIWSLHYNLGTDTYGDLFLDYYGRDTIDVEKLRLVAAFEAFG